MRRFGISILVAVALAIVAVPELASAHGPGFRRAAGGDVRLGAGPFVGVPGHGGFIVAPNHQFQHFNHHRHFTSPHVVITQPQFVWQPGFWQWNGNQWLWTPSRWIQVFPR